VNSSTDYFLHKTTAGALTPPEQYDFELIIANARSSGWITLEQRVTAERHASAIIVRTHLGSSERQRTYEDSQRWMYELLHDLAHGLWR
jgi:hypothetical protein